MYPTTTKNKKKLEHQAIIAKWQREKAMVCAVGLLKRVYLDTADEKVKEMYHGILEDQRKINNPYFSGYSVSDGFDVFLECYAYLREMNKCGLWQLYTPETVELTMMRGKKKKVSLYQGMRYKARNYIYKHGQIDRKTFYIEDLNKEDDDGNELNCYDELANLCKVSQYYDIDNMQDYFDFKGFISSLNLTARQKQILHYRLKGLSVSEIAERLGVKHYTISKQLIKIQEDVKSLYPEAVRGFKEKRKAQA